MKDMKSTRSQMVCEAAFYGSVTVGERGQVVIPAEARNDLGIVAGEKLLIMRHPVHHGLMLCRLQDVRDFLEDFSQRLDEVEQKSAAEDSK